MITTLTEEQDYGYRRNKKKYEKSKNVKWKITRFRKKVKLILIRILNKNKN